MKTSKFTVKTVKKFCTNLISDLEENLHDDRQVEVSWIELVELEERQIGLEVVCVTVFGLHIHVALQRRDVLRVVALDAAKHSAHLHLHRV